MKILSIGNSFSEDATAYLQGASDGEIFVRNLFIGGCSLERHANNIKTGASEYDYQKDGVCVEKISIPDALKREKWDVVTVQQVSGLSGIYESYEPYMTEVLNYVRKCLPDVKIVLHRTWAYEVGSTHDDFPRYGCSQPVMFEKIIEASTAAAKKHALSIIPVGNAVQEARKLPEFDISHGGVSITRDTFHLSLPYGRYLAALVWYEFFTGKNAEDVKFEVDGSAAEINAKLKKVAHMTVQNCK